MRSIWAVAKNTIAQALRMKVAVLIILLLLVMLPLMAMITEGDGTLKGKLQTFVSYGLSLMSLMLCMFTITISSYILANDIKRKHIFLVVTKPVRRFQIICGKFLGVVLLDIFLLAIFAVMIYSGTKLIPRLSGAGDAEKALVQRQFFTARKELTSYVDEKKLDTLAMQVYMRLEKVNQLPETMTKKQVLKELRNQEVLKSRAVEVGTEKAWVFDNVGLLAEGETLFVQFKYEAAVTPPSGKIVGQWAVGDDRQRLKGVGERKTEIYEVPPRRDKTRTMYEFEVPADCVAEDGRVAVIFRNPYVNNTTVMPKDIKLLYRSGSFEGNYIRAVLLVLTRLIFLAALGVSLSTWLSFPVAIFICIVFFFVGTFYGFIFESFGTLSLNTNVVYSFTIKPLLWLIPKFDGDHNPSQFITFAKLLNTEFLARVYLVTVFMKSMILLLFGMLIFRRREIARITV